MNILRYRWSAIVAAGLHGALFISSSHSRIVPDTTATVIVDLALPPPPLEKLIQFDDPDTSASSEDKLTASSPAMPEISETPTPPSLDRAVITIPVRENTSVRPDSRLILRGEGVDGPLQGGAINVGRISGLKDLDRVPRATAQIPPDYPATMRQNGEKGSVMVQFDVDTSGRVVRAEAVRYTHREFVDPAVRAVLKWHFEPGKRQGRPVPFRMAVPIEFGLSEN